MYIHTHILKSHMHINTNIDNYIKDTKSHEFIKDIFS